jgi:hypothetical protein
MGSICAEIWIWRTRTKGFLFPSYHYVFYFFFNLVHSCESEHAWKEEKAYSFGHLTTWNDQRYARPHGTKPSGRMNSRNVTDDVRRNELLNCLPRSYWPFVVKYLTMYETSQESILLQRKLRSCWSSDFLKYELSTICKPFSLWYGLNDNIRAALIVTLPQNLL